MLSNFERYPLTFGPTPIERLSRLTAHLGGDVEIFAKREDCNSGLAFGGNKLRKLEYIVPDAIASNADTLVSIGGVQSNHTRMVAAVAGFSPMFRTALSPAPSPRTARPPDSSSMLAIAPAVTVGWRVIGLVTPGPIFARAVFSATRVSAT